MQRACGALACAAFVACGSPGPVVRAPVTAGPAARAQAYPNEDARWPKFHSVRFRLSVPLPDGKAWRIDDHSQPELHASHDATASHLVVWSGSEFDLVNHAACEERARARGLVPEDPKRPLNTVEDTVTIGPAAYDTRLLVAVEPGKDANQPVVGHVFAFGAFIRSCLFVHVWTEVPSAKDEEILSERLALAKVRVVGGITLDPPRTSVDAELPTEKR